jgi:hypothetical protein
MRVVAPLLALALAATALAGCQTNPFQVTRSSCPAVAVPTYAGDTTLFGSGASPDAGNIDVVATITNVRENCVDATATLATSITYDVIARRTNTVGARQLALPVFASVVQGGNLLVSKQIGSVTVAFADGQARATGQGGARAAIARSAMALPDAITTRIKRKRKAGDADAATDPLADPEVKAAIRAASFEVLVGFQLSDTALAYNVSK